ncbi:S8 family serine peptidase [Seongchinamella sediminis]|uniref:S8 family serine peptidase n=1 Tax=Seongchinamella sediminis TaxID=2283635 RepID=UPI001EF1411A|nr:S8 family serine peptidase [Seongchinamella sediminis]
MTIIRSFARSAVAATVLGLCMLGAGIVQAQVPGVLTGTEVEEQVEDDIEDEVEDSVNDSVADATDEDVQESVEDAVEEAVEDGLTLGVDINIGNQVEDQVEDQVEETVEETIEDESEQIAEETVEDLVEETVEEQITETVTEDVEQNVDETVEDAVEETVAQNVEDSVQDQVEESVQEEVAHNVEETVEDGVEEQVEAGLESSVEENVAQNVEAGVESSVEESVAQTVEAGVESSVEENVAQTVAAGVESSVEDTIAQTVEMSAEVQVADSVEERFENQIDDILDTLESDLEVDEDRIAREQWLVMAEPEVFEELAEKGYLFDTVTDLPALGMRLAEVAGPSSFDITEVRRGVLDVVGKDRAEVDLNHIYTAGTELVATETGIAPRQALSLPESRAANAPRIGMIDSRVDVSHPALALASIESRSFVSRDGQLPDFHGTAIASIIAANDVDYQGLMPDAQLYAAAVFEQDEERGEIASTVSLLRALDWLISSEVDVVNISLAGPPNRLLETALKRAASQQVLVMAAAGNGGPVAQPMYPAAYESVVAVTAVDEGRQVFRLANRGTYLDIAAPGVGLLHARAGGGYVASSGTSFAVPFAATAAARLLSEQPGVDVMTLLYRSAEDLGPPGRDEIYGHGLLRLTGI